MKEETKEQRLKKTVQEFNKSQGKVMIKSASEVEVREKLSFGVPELDKLTNGGIQYGVTTVIWGEESIGKTTLALKLITQAQKEGKVCFYADIERSFNAAWAKKQGVDIDKLIYGAFYLAEQSMDSIIALAKEKCVDVIVVDSIQGLSPKQEQIEGKGEKVRSVESDTMALLARKLSQFFRIAIPYISDAKTALILIGQARTNLGGFIALETLSGGHALKHNSRLTLRVRRGQKVDAPVEIITDDEGKKHTIQLGFDQVVKIEKQQMEGVKELDEVHLSFYFGSGFTQDAETMSEETEQKVKQGLKEAGEGKLISQKELETEGLLDKPKKKRGRPCKVKR
jgi:recombination protein RecA